MAHTYTSLFYHIVFSTKHRHPWIKPEIEEQVWAYIGGVARAHHMTAVQVGGIDEHIHALIMAKPTLAPSQIAQYIKGDSSKWIHETFPALHRFRWQEGYGAFTVSRSGVDAVIRYIQTQRAHHRNKSFQEEYLEFLKVHNIEYDSRYIWD